LDNNKEKGAGMKKSGMTSIDTCYAKINDRPIVGSQKTLDFKTLQNTLKFVIRVTILH